MNVAICDNCGYQDDTQYSRDKPPILDHGVVLQFRGECSDSIEHELELCPNCKEELLKHFPKLKERL